jgi:chromate transport protein ChrA
MSEKHPPTLFELFIVFARISALTIGGGYVVFSNF